MSTAIMSAPSSAMRTACARPWPGAAPVMNAILPSRRLLMAPHFQVGFRSAESQNIAGLVPTASSRTDPRWGPYRGILHSSNTSTPPVVQSIPAGAVGTYYGAPAVTSTLHKTQLDGGIPQRWWVSPPVVHALTVAEQITRDQRRL